MDASRWCAGQVLLYREPVDMRKSIDGLSVLVVDALGRDPMDCSVYVFVNKARDKMKLLVWHRNGFWLLYKRLVRQRFKWPDWFSDEALELSHEQLDYLLDGYNLNGMRPHHAITIGRAF